MGKRSSPHGDTLAEIAEDVARRFMAFDSYGSEAGAVAALRRRCPDVDRGECIRAFELAKSTYEAALRHVDRHQGRLWDAFKQDSSNVPDMTDLVAAMSKELPDLDPQRAASVLSWVFYWHHLR